MFCLFPHQDRYVVPASAVVPVPAEVPAALPAEGAMTLEDLESRGAADFDGQGEVVSAIVVMRHGENALDVITRVERKIDQLRPTLPPGVEIVTTYDRSELILRAIATLKSTLIEELIIVSIIILIFLWHVPSAIIPA